MRHPIALLIVITTLLTPAALFGQDRVERSLFSTYPAMETTEPASPAAELGAQAPPPQQRPAAPPPQVERPRRRPSMVGYIGDGVVRSQLRLRFDAGFGITSPDRAEFFYAKCGCFARLPAGNPNFDPNAPGPGPGIANDLDFQQLYLLGEYVVLPRVSLFAELPFRWLKPQGFIQGRPCCPAGSFSDSPGISDLAMGAKLGLVETSNRHVTAQMQLRAPTGDASKGLGTDHWSVEPALLYGEWLTDRLSLEAQAGAVLPTDGSAGLPTSGSGKYSGSVFYYGIGPSFELYASDRLRFAPVVELVGWRVLSGFQSSDNADVTGTNIVNLKIGGRVTMRDRSSIYVGFGRALTDAAWYDDILRVEYRFSF